MTLNEFRAWLDGYAASIDGAPTAEQWEAIKAKLVEVAEAPSAPVLPVPTYPYYPTWPLDITCSTYGGQLQVGPQAYQGPTR